MRGGINGIAMQKNLHMFISWYGLHVFTTEGPNLNRQDYVCSCLTSARFTQIHSNAFAHAPTFFFRKPTVKRVIEENVAATPIPADLRNVLVPVFRDLRTLAEMAPDFANQTTTCSPRYMAFTQTRVSLDHRAFDLPTILDHQEKHYSSTLIACCMAVLAFTHMTLRDYQPTCTYPLVFVPCFTYI